MKVCSVCDKSCNNLGGEIIQGANREWVCKNCLQKAGVSVTHFTFQEIGSEQIINAINNKQDKAEISRSIQKQINITKNDFNDTYYSKNIKNKKKRKTFLTVALPIASLSLCMIVIIFAIWSILFKTDISTKSKNENSSVQGIVADKNILGDVKITIPSTLSEGIDTLITDEQKDLGVSKIEKQADGSAVITIKRSKYKDFLEYYRNTVIESITQPIDDGTYTTIKSVDYNKDFSKITLNVNKAEYENSFESMAVMVYGLAGMMYQTFDVDAPQKVTVTVKDIETKTIVSTTVYPDAMQE